MTWKKPGGQISLRASHCRCLRLFGRSDPDGYLLQCNPAMPVHELTLARRPAV